LGPPVATSERIWRVRSAANGSLCWTFIGPLGRIGWTRGASGDNDGNRGTALAQVGGELAR
jgi:hypothetical protein